MKKLLLKVTYVIVNIMGGAGFSSSWECKKNALNMVCVFWLVFVVTCNTPHAGFKCPYLEAKIIRLDGDSALWTGLASFLGYCFLYFSC